MDIDKIYHLRWDKFGKKALKLLIAGLMLLFVLFVILFIFAVIFASKYHTQIYDGFLRGINYVFGDSPDNVIRSYLKQIVDEYIKSLFNEN